MGNQKSIIVSSRKRIGIFIEEKMEDVLGNAKKTGRMLKTETKQTDEIAWRLHLLDKMDAIDEDEKTLTEAYDSLLEAYQEARSLNEELEEMLQEYTENYGAL